MTAKARADLERAAGEAASALPELMAAAEHAAQVVTAGRHARRRAGRSDTFWQFRDYAHGDPVSSIDWRQSARLERRLLVRQTEWEQPQTLLLWCGGDEDFDYGGEGRETKRFRGQVITLAAAMLALRGGERVGIWGSPQPPKAGLQAVPSLAHDLLTADHSYADLPPTPGAAVLLVSDFHDDPKVLHRAFQAVRDARGQPVAVVVEDPSEESFPFAGSLRFETPGGALRRFFGEAAAVREDYLARRAAHHAALRSAVGASGEAVLLHETSQPTSPLLLQLSELLAAEGR